MRLDIFVINKSDRKGADDTRRDIQQMLELSSLGEWEPPIVMTVATDQVGADELWRTVGEHRSYLEGSGEHQARRSLRVQAELTEIVSQSLEQRVITAMERPETTELKEKLARGEIAPYAAAARLIDLSDG